MRGGVLGVLGDIVTSSRNRLCSDVDFDFGVAGVVIWLARLYFRGGVTTRGSLFSFWSTVEIPGSGATIILGG